jgi:hypothetical protein
MKLGQTAVEYLILTSVVLVIALIALYSFDALPSLGGGLSSAKNANARVLPVGILDILPQGNYTAFVVQNTVADSAVSVEKIANENGDCTILPNQPRTLAIGQKRIIHAVCENHSKYYVNTTRQMSFEEDIHISYMNLKTTAMYNESTPYVIRQRIGELPVVTINPTHLGHMYWYQAHVSANGVYQLVNPDCCGLWFSNNSGINWYNIASMNPTNQYFDSAMDADASIIATHMSGRVYISRNYGLSWNNSVSLPTGINDLALSDAGDIVFVGTENGYMYVVNTTSLNFTSVATQESWQKIALSQSGQYVTAVSWGGKISVSNDYGATWIQRHTNATRRDVDMSHSGQYQLTATDSGQLSVSSDYGVTWTDVGLSKGYGGVAMTPDGSRMFASAYDDYIYTSTDYGSTWTITSPRMNWVDVDVSDDCQTIVTQANNYAIVHSYDCGSTWFTYDKSRQFFDVEMSTSGQYQLAVDDNGYLYVSQDYGVSWMKKHTTNRWRYVAMSDSGQYQYALGYFGGFSQSFDYGSTWSSPQTGISSYAYSGLCTIANGSTVLISTDDVRFFIRYSDTANFTNIYNGTGGNEQGACSISDSGNDLLVFVTSGIIYRSSNGGVTWSNQTFGHSLKRFDSSANGSVVVGIFSQTINSSMNAGASWSPVSEIPSYWAWESVFVSKSGQSILVSGNGYLYSSQNYGVNWTIIPINVTGGTSYWQGVAMSESGQYITIVARGGLIHVSSDAGATFTEITSYS